MHGCLSMATAETTEVASKKRKSSEEKDTGHSSRKKLKGSSSETSRKSKKRKKEKESDGPLRVRSISELARLVSSGAIRVPKSLITYADDRTQLMDQVFTILSPDDIKGMLPDILKGLRMKQVKQLCYEQLKNMTSEAIKQTIEPEDTDLETGLDAVLSELIGKTGDSQRELQSSPTDSASKSVLKREECQPNTEFVDKRSTLKKVATGSNIVSSKNVQVDSSSGTPVKEIVIRVSDVSGSESEDEMRKKKGGQLSDSQLDADSAKSSLASSAIGSEVIDKSSIKVSSSATREEDRIEIHAEIPCDETDLELGGQRGFHAGSLSEESDSGDDLSDTEDHWDSGVPEAAILLEMELRKRALESELRKTSIQSSGEPDESRADIHGSNDQDMDSAFRASVAACCKESDLWDEPTEGGRLDQAQLLELKLRQKALQSLLSKRKQSQS